MLDQRQRRSRIGLGLIVAGLLMLLATGSLFLLGSVSEGAGEVAALVLLAAGAAVKASGIALVLSARRRQA